MKKNQRFIEYLYESASSEDSNGINKFDEQKLRRELKQNKKLCARNSELFARYEPNYYKCEMYDPCPICDKCRNKASHLYVKCQNCLIPMCAHTYKDRKNMIRRYNFELNVSKETIKIFRDISKKLK